MLQPSHATTAHSSHRRQSSRRSREQMMATQWILHLQY
jgi:hypothetical protein